MQRTQLDIRYRSASLTAGLLLACLLLGPTAANAMCDVIPSRSLEFRGALGSLNRPFAIPGDSGEIITVSLKRDPLKPNQCDAASVGFPASAASESIASSSAGPSASSFA